MRRRHDTEFKARQGPRAEPSRAAPAGQFGDEDHVDFAGLRQRQDLLAVRRAPALPRRRFPSSSGQEDGAQALRDFVADNEILTLNVAGPRESKEPGVAEFVREVLERRSRSSPRFGLNSGVMEVT